MGRSALLQILEACQDEDHKQAILNLAGEADAVADVATEPVRELLMVLPLPHSGGPSISKGMRLPFDAMLLEDDLEIKITINRGNEVYNKYKAYRAAGGKWPSLDIEVVMERLALVNPQQSLAFNADVMSGKERVNYAFIYPNSLQLSRIPSNAETAQSVASVSGWRSGGTVALTLAVLQEGVDYENDPGNNTDHNKYQRIEGLEVIMDGQRIVTNRGRENELFSLLRQGNEDNFGAGGVIAPENSYYQTVFLSQSSLKQVLGENHVSGGVDLTSKTITFRYNTPAGTAGQTHTLYIVQHINGVLSSGAGRNVFVFNP
jgi:hypothetical protein